MCEFFVSSTGSTRPANFVLLYSVTLIMLGEDYKIIKLLITHISSPIFSPLS